MTQENPFEDEDTSIHLNEYLRPEMLHNTAFFAKRPVSSRKYYTDRMKKFMGAHKMTPEVFSEFFLPELGNFKKLDEGTYSPHLTAIETTMRLMQDYDKEFRAKPTFNYKKRDMRKVICSQIELFCLRHNITQSIFSEVFFGTDTYYFMFKEGTISCKLSRIDKIFYDMHLEDLLLIKKMGPRYDEWVIREKAIKEQRKQERKNATIKN